MFIKKSFFAKASSSESEYLPKVNCKRDVITFFVKLFLKIQFNGFIWLSCQLLMSFSFCWKLTYGDVLYVFKHLFIFSLEITISLLGGNDLINTRKIESDIRNENPWNHRTLGYVWNDPAEGSFSQSFDFVFCLVKFWFPGQPALLLERAWDIVLPFF